MLRAFSQASLPDATEWQVIAAQYPEPTPQPIPADPGPPPTLDDLFMANGDPERAPGLLVDTDGDRLPDDTRCCFHRLGNISREIGAALVDAVARLGVETAGLTVPLCAPLDLGAAVPVFIGDAAPAGIRSDCPVLHSLDDGRTAVIIAGETDTETAAMLRALAADGPIHATSPSSRSRNPRKRLLWSWEWEGRTERETLLAELNEHALPAAERCAM